MAERQYFQLRDGAKQLERWSEPINKAIKQLFYFDFMLAVSRFSQEFGLTVPELIDGGLGVIKGRNIFLVDEALSGGENVVPVSYSIGKANVGIFGATPHPVATLTGANSGGKTCLLIMLASSIILTELGLPVPAERAEIPVLPLYLYRRKMIKKTGSFEYSMRALSRIFMREGAKVVLIDELEALTEPGAMGRIMASVLNNLPNDTLAVMITHLIHELLPHISMKKVRVDGIESEGLDAAGNIIVDRQPMFNHIGSSTPELVITKLLGRVRKAELKAVYEEILKVLEKDREEWS
jgi:DNA mismatch repair protein MutS2